MPRPFPLSVWYNSVDQKACTYDSKNEKCLSMTFTPLVRWVQQNLAPKAPLQGRCQGGFPFFPPKFARVSVAKSQKPQSGHRFHFHHFAKIPKRTLNPPQKNWTRLWRRKTATKNCCVLNGHPPSPLPKKWPKIWVLGPEAGVESALLPACLEQPVPRRPTNLKRSAKGVFFKSYK